MNFRKIQVDFAIVHKAFEIDIFEVGLESAPQNAAHKPVYEIPPYTVSYPRCKTVNFWELSKTYEPTHAL